jgi:hypothetical protein
MNKYHPVIAVILGNTAIALLVAFVKYLPVFYLTDILAVFIVIFGGFVATYLSKINKARMGLYNSLLYSLGSLLGIFIFKTGLTLNNVLILVLLLPISGLIGGFIAKKLRSKT